MTQSDVSRAAGSLEAQPVVQIGARVGYALSGVLHLSAVALGIAAYGVYSFARARYARV